MSKILLVDDDDSLRRMLHITLQQLGHTVIEARNGKDAVMLQSRESFDVMLTDIVMPEKEGLETILEFRRKFPEVAVIAMSGGGRMPPAHYLSMAKMLGARAVLTKPFSTEDLAAALKSVTKA
jgi:YesN/AraC family two-component response regulator